MSGPDALTGRPALTCDEVRPMLPQVAEGTLDHAADPALFDHLARCPVCQDALAQHDLIALALERSRPAAPLRLASPRNTVRVPLPLAAAAILALVAGGAWLALRPAAPAAAAPVADVIKVVDPVTGAVRYVVRDAKGGYVVDPAALDGRAAAGSTRSDTRQVDLKH